MIWSNILELLINFKLEFATLAFNMTPFGPYGFYKQVNNSGQLEFKSLKLVSVNNGVGLCYETPNEVVVFIGNVLPPNSNNDIYLADTPEDVADIPTESLNAGDLVYIISTESYQSWDGDSWEDYTPGEALIPPLADVLDQGNTSGPNDIIFDASQGLQFNNSSKLREGTTNAGLGGNKGVAQVCSLDYELKWEAGRLYVMEQDGTTIRQSLYNFTTTPTATDDSSLGYSVGSLWTLDDGTTYECIDATATSADWIKTNQSKFIEITKAQLLALEGAGTLSVNVWYKVTDALGSTAKILVSATSVSIVSKSAINLTDGTFGQYTLSGDTYLAISGATNLSYTPSPTNGIVTSDTGNDATLPLADGTNAGLLKPADFTQLSTLATDLGNKVTKNTAITGATKTKITYDSKGLVTSGADATTADIADSTNKRYVSDAQLTVIGNTSGTNTGDNATNSQYSGLAASKADVASPTFTGTVTTPAIIVSSETASRVAIIDASKNVKSADTVTYPSLTELARVKGVTSAIQTQINARRKTLQSTGLGAVVSGNTNITLSKSILIPANTFVAGDIPKVTTRILKTGAVGGYTPRMYLNTSNNISGAVLVGTGYVGANTNFASGMERVISIESATGANTFVHNTTTAIGLECINYTGSESTLTINWTVDQYLLVAIQLVDGTLGDTANCRYILIN